MPVLVSTRSSFSAGSASIDAIATLSGAGYTLPMGSGSIGAIAGLAGSGVAVSSDMPDGEGVISAIASLSGTGQVTKSGSGSINAVARLTSVGQAIKQGSATINAVAILAGTGVAPDTPFNEGSGTINAVARLAGLGVTPGNPPNEGSGTITAVAACVGSGHAPSAPAGPRRITFHLDNRFVTQGHSPASEATIAARLSRYVDDCNTIYAKTTDLELVYNPATDCFFHDPQEIVDHSFFNQDAPVPADWHLEFWVFFHTGVTSAAGSSANGGRQSESGWGGLDLGWIAVWSNAETDSSELLPSGFATKSEDYVYHLYLLIHEGLHNFGIGIGEYYSTNQIRDFTGVEPDLSMSNTGTFPVVFEGIYWDARPLPQTDVMCRRNDTDRVTWLSIVELCPLTSFIVNEVMAGEHPSNDIAYLFYDLPQTDVFNSTDFEVLVEVRRASDSTPISGATVDMYAQDRTVYSAPFLFSPPTATEITDASGQATFVWGGPLDNTIFVGNNIFRGFKVSAPGFVNNGDGLSTWDINAGELMPGGGTVGDFRYTPPLVIELEAE